MQIGELQKVGASYSVLLRFNRRIVDSMLLDVLRVEAQKDFVLLLEFENWERRRFWLGKFMLPKHDYI